MKNVSYIIRVPHGDKCWDGKQICGFFDNHGGYNTCRLGFCPDQDETKDTECMALEEV